MAGINAALQPARRAAAGPAAATRPTSACWSTTWSPAASAASRTACSPRAPSTGCCCARTTPTCACATIGHRVGAVRDERLRTHRAPSARCDRAHACASRADTSSTPSRAINARLVALGSAPLRLPCSARAAAAPPRAHAGRRLDAGRFDRRAAAAPDCAAQVEVAVKYAGYVERQQDAIERAARMERARIPAALDYAAIPGLSREVRERLTRAAAALARPGVAHRRHHAGRGVAARRSICAAWARVTALRARVELWMRAASRLGRAARVVRIAARTGV